MNNRPVQPDRVTLNGYEETNQTTNHCSLCPNEPCSVLETILIDSKSQVVWEKRSHKHSLSDENQGSAHTHTNFLPKDNKILLDNQNSHLHL